MKLANIAFSAVALLGGALAAVVYEDGAIAVEACSLQSLDCPQARCMAPPTGCEINTNPALILDDAGECCPKSLCDFVHTADQTPCAAAEVDEIDPSKSPTDAAEEEESDPSKPPTDAAEEEGSDPSKPPTDAAEAEESDPSKPLTDAAEEEESGAGLGWGEGDLDPSEYDCRTKEVWSAEKTTWCCANHNLGCPATSGEAEIPTDDPCAQQVCIMVVLECADGETRKVAEGDCCESCVVDAPATTTDPEFELSAACRTKELWSEKKAAWCCENHDLGCPTDVVVPGKPGKEIVIEESEAVEESARAEIHTGIYLTIALGGVMLACIAGYAMHVKNSDGHSRLRAVKEALVINPDDLYRDDNAVVIVAGNGRAAFTNHSAV